MCNKKVSVRCVCVKLKMPSTFCSFSCHPFMYIKGHHLYLQAVHMKEKVMEWAAAEAKVDHHKEEEQGRGGQ